MFVESNLRPLIVSSPAVFENCINTVPVNSVTTRFNAIYERCVSEESSEKETTAAPDTDCTDNDEASGCADTDELSNSYILA